MSGGWLDVQGPSGTQRAALLEGLTRIGGAGADVVLPALGPDAPGTDQLHVWNRPPRMLFMGAGPRPTARGEPFEERDLKPGDRIQWAGCTLVYGGEAASADLAPLEELAPPAPALGVASGTGAAPGARVAERALAGLACELGLADAQAQRRWRESVVAGRFDPDACARELVPRALTAEAEQRLLERSGTLLRDFLMAALLSGSAGARRKVRETSRGLAAFLLAQGLALLVFSALVGAALFLMRAKGASIDAFLDRFLPD